VEKQDDKEALSKAVLKITRLTGLFLIAPTVLAIICSKAILTLVFGAEYSAVGVPFGLLCVYVVLLIQGTVFAAVLLGIGQPSKHRTFVGVRALILVVFIYPAIKLFGLTGAAVIVMLASLSALCLQVFVLRKVIGLRIFDYIISWVPGVVAAFPVFSIVFFMQYVRADTPMLHLSIGAFVSVVVCLGGFFVLEGFAKASRRAVGKPSVVEPAGKIEVENV